MTNALTTNTGCLDFCFSDLSVNVHYQFSNRLLAFFFLLISKGFSEKAMEPHSSTLAWKIPWMEEPGGLQSMGSLRVGYD